MLSCIRFEAFNSVIRQLNCFSNRHASSKDIGEKFVKHHQLKFLINGGYWKNGDNRYVSMEYGTLYVKHYNKLLKIF